MIKLPVNTKRIPERNCVGCGKSFPKFDLVRIVRTPNGNIELDPTGKMSGRGAYLCKNKDCFKNARKAKRFERSLSASIPEDVLDKLEGQVDNNGK